MSEPNRKRPRVTPRNSTADLAIATVANVTPFQDLHQLGKIIHKPNTPHHAITTRLPSSGRRSASRAGTPGTATRTPTIRSARATPARRGPPTTPHAIRAQLQTAQQRRNAGHTPGRDRRRSGRLGRETPRDDLRALSRALAKNSKADPPTPQARNRSSRAASYRDESNSPRLERPPRLSMARSEYEDDSFHLRPPRLSVALEDDPEDGRRAYLNRRERESLGSLRFSGRFGDMNESGLNEDEEQESLDDLAAAATSLMDDMISDEDIAENETTRHLRALMEADDGLSGRQSGDLGMRQSLGTDGEQTFEFRIPDLSRDSPGRSEDMPREDTMYAQEDLDADNGAEQNDGYSEASEDNQFVDYEEVVEDVGFPEQSIHQPLRRTPLQAKSSNPTVRIPKTLHRSKLGNEYPSLPPSVIKKLASTYSRTCGGNGRLNKDTILALSQASDWFFEQISDDLATYSTHARRKTIEEADVITLMKRQRQLNNQNTLFSVAQKSLPAELLQAVRMAPITKSKGKKRRLDTIAEED